MRRGVALATPRWHFNGSLVPVPGIQENALRKVCAAILVLLPGVIGACDKREGVVYQNVSIVDVRGKKIQPAADIYVVGQQIVATAPTGTLNHNAADVIDMDGAYAMPGLTDGHVHVDTRDRLALMLPAMADTVVTTEQIASDIAVYLLYGVTQIMVLEGNDKLLDVRALADDPGAFLPRMVVASPILDGPESNNPVHEKVANASGGITAVHRSVSDGYDLIKVYNGLDADTRNAIIETAALHEVPVVGHIPPAMPFEEAIVPGFAMVAHAEEITRMWDGQDPAYLSRAISLMRHNRVALTPNLIAYREIVKQVSDIDAHLDTIDFTLVPPLARRYSTPPDNGYVESFANSETSDRYIAYFNRTALTMDTLTAAAHKDGILLLAGTDVGNPTMFPGVSLWDELALLAATGLDPFETIATATTNIATFLGDNERGTIAEGFIADVVFLDVNPIDGVENVSRDNIVAILRSGARFDRAYLDDAAKRLAREYDQRDARYKAALEAARETTE